jgi:LacI family transcriptional regulator
MATIFDIAKKAKVSVVTVSRLLNNPQIVSSRTAAKIYAVMEDLNYQPSQIARSMVSKRTNTIGVIMPDIKNTFFNSWFRFIEDYAASHGFNLLLCNTDEDAVKELNYIRLLQSQRVDGIIIAPGNKESVEYLLRSNIRFVLFDRVYSSVKNNYVTTDHYQGAFDAAEYLVKLGHKKIAVLRGSGTLYPDKERYSGFEDAMKKYRLKIIPELILNCGLTEETAYKKAHELFEYSEKPTAIFSFNSLMTTGVIKALQKMNLSIPKDISLLSFDEIPGQEIFNPKITHINQPVNLLGKETIAALIDMIKHPEKKKRVKLLLKPALVIGDSCRPLIHLIILITLIYLKNNHLFELAGI